MKLTDGAENIMQEFDLENTMGKEFLTLFTHSRGHKVNKVVYLGLSIWIDGILITLQFSW